LPSFNDVIAGSLAQSAQVQQIIDALKGTPSKGVPIAITAVNDSANYALSVQNDDPTNSRALSVLAANGTTLITADINGVTLGSPVNMPPGALSGASLAPASVTNAMLGPDVARASLLVNGGFEIWQRGGGPYTASNAFFADRWLQTLVGTDTFSTSSDTINYDAGSGSRYCAATTFTIGTGAGQSYQGQLLNATDGHQVRSRTFSFSIRVRTSTANAVRAAIKSDGTGGTTTYSGFHPGTGAYATLNVTATLPADATYLYVLLYYTASCTAYLDNAVVVSGSQYANYVPLTPADEWTRCLRYYEQLGLSGGNDLIVRGYAGVASEGLDLSVQFRVLKPVTPTVTKYGTWATANCAAASPSITAPTSYGCRLSLSSTSTGDTYAVNATAGNYVTAEANP
jgi:hypothetical protein